MGCKSKQGHENYVVEQSLSNVTSNEGIKHCEGHWHHRHSYVKLSDRQLGPTFSGCICFVVVMNDGIKYRQ